MMESLRRVGLLAHNTLLEALRQKTLNLLLLFGLVCIGSANAFTGFTFDEQIKFVKDFSFGAMTVFGTLIALLGAAQMVQSEIESRTVYTILSKPVRRAELLWGKFLGLAALIVLALGLMTAVLALVLAVKERALVAETLREFADPNQEMARQAVAKVEAQVRDPQLVQALVLTLAKVLLTAGLATLISTFATSMIFTVSTSLLIYLIGHLQAVAREVWFASEAPAFWQRAFAGGLAIFVPDFSAFGILDDILAGSAVPWSHTWHLLGYTGLYLLVLMLVAQVVLNDREL